MSLLDLLQQFFKSLTFLISWGRLWFLELVGFVSSCSRTLVCLLLARVGLPLAGVISLLLELFLSCWSCFYLAVGPVLFSSCWSFFLLCLLFFLSNLHEQLSKVSHNSLDVLTLLVPNSLKLWILKVSYKTFILMFLRLNNLKIWDSFRVYHKNSNVRFLRDGHSSRFLVTEQIFV